MPFVFGMVGILCYHNCVCGKTLSVEHALIMSYPFGGFPSIQHNSGESRIFERWFPLVVDHRCRGLGAQPPAAEKVLIFKSIQSIESYNILYLRPELATFVSVVS